ncbi:MAG: T9SS type A sorting domain-containing protein [Bacteroidota bacterium]
MTRYTPLLLIATLAVLPGRGRLFAQPLQATHLEVRWDSLGPGAERRFGRTTLADLAIQPAANGDPFADTLFAVNGGDVYRLAPGDAFFGPSFNESGNPSPGQLYFVTVEGTHLSNRRGLNYSPDRGVTWVIPPAYIDGELLVRDANVNGFAESTTLGALAAGQGGYLWQSTDEGRTWNVRHDFEIGFSNAYAVAELAGDTRPGAEASPWAGRLVMGFRGPIRYSDDQGQTWTEVMLPVTDDWSQIEEAPDGTLYLGGTFGTFVYTSADGGASWREFVHFRPGDPGDFLDGEPRQAQIAVAPDGALWVGLSAIDGDPTWEATFVYTRDGGATWTEASEGFVRQQVNALEVDSAGRLVAVTRVGAWRTAEPVVVSAEEDVPEEPSGARLGTPYPNPTSEQITVPLVLRDAAEVRVSVVDLLGREVAVVAEGTRAAGTHTLTFETAGWPAGVYVVRATVEGATETRRVTVAW